MTDGHPNRPARLRAALTLIEQTRGLRIHMGTSGPDEIDTSDNGITLRISDGLPHDGGLYVGSLCDTHPQSARAFALNLTLGGSHARTAFEALDAFERMILDRLGNHIRHRHASGTLCGANMEGFDLLSEDAENADAEGSLADWVDCDDCRAIWEGGLA